MCIRDRYSTDLIVQIYTYKEIQSKALGGKLSPVVQLYMSVVAVPFNCDTNWVKCSLISLIVHFDGRQKESRGTFCFWIGDPESR